MGHLVDDKKAKSKKQLAKKLIEAEERTRTKAIEERKQFKGLQFAPTASFFDDADKKEPGEGNFVGLGFDIHPQVTFFSAAILIIFIVLTLMFREQAGDVFKSGMSVITKYMGWFMILVANLAIIAAIYFSFSRLGKIKIGGNDAVPEFSTMSWYAMLLSAGMGIGLMFWSIGEPIYHFLTPSPMFIGVEGGSAQAAQAAMGVTYFHWGLHPWAIYSIVGLGLAIFSYNRGLPLSVRSIFYPILGNKIYGFWGNLIDIVSVLATIVGLATSLGFGAQQVNAGLNFLFGVSVSVETQVILIIVITLIATTSVIAGLDAGVKKLSQINMGLAGFFLLVLLVVGPTVYILGASIQNLGFYLQKLPQLSFWTETFQKSNWQGSWTVFYWAWWISWSPFVGMFIARISKGRTVKEFIIGVMVIPTLLSFIVLSIFGSSALFLQTSGAADIATAVKSDVATALFVMLKAYPLTNVLSVIGIVLVTLFFVTSSDSGSLVVDHLTSGGKLDSPVPQRVFWALIEGVVAAVLLIGGGLKTLQTATVCTGLPFGVMLIFMIYSIYIGLTQDAFVEDTVKDRLDEVEEEHRFQEAIDGAVHDDALL